MLAALAIVFSPAAELGRYAASNHRVMRRSSVQAPIVGAGMFAAWVVLPGAFGALAARLGAWTLAMGLLLPWSSLIFPHGSTWLRDGMGAQRAWSSSIAIFLATAQWIVAALAFGWRTRFDPVRERFWSAPVVVIAIAILVRLGLHLCGFTVEMDGP